MASLGCVIAFINSNEHNSKIRQKLINTEVLQQFSFCFEFTLCNRNNILYSVYGKKDAPVVSLDIKNS